MSWPDNIISMKPLAETSPASPPPLAPKVISLFGSEDENFYQLGLFHREDAPLLIEHLLKMLHLSQGSLKIPAGGMAMTLLKRHLNLSTHLRAYAEGVNIDYQTLCLSLLIPEILSALSIKNSGNAFPLWGCTSFAYFVKPVAQLPTAHHLRILDFPISAQIAKSKSIVIWQDQKCKLKIVFSSPPGLPFPGLTAMTENGFSFALHQKFTAKFNLSGTPILYQNFVFLKKLLQLKSEQIKNSAGALKEIIHESRLITTWGFNITTPQGLFLAADVGPKGIEFEQDYKVVPLAEQNALQTNLNLSPRQKSEHTIPYGMEAMCEQKEANMRPLLQRNVGKITDQQILNSLFSELHKTPLSFQPVNLTSCDVVIMIPAEGKILALPNSFPLETQSGICEISNLFSDQHQLKILPLKGKSSPPPHPATRHLALAQMYADTDTPHLLIHHLQLALKKIPSISKLESSHELAFTFLQFALYLQNAWSPLRPEWKVLYNYLFQNLQRKYESGPPPQNPFFWLLFHRLAKTLQLPSPVRRHHFHQPYFHKIFKKDQSMNTAQLELSKKLIHIRMEMQQILFLYE